MESNRLLDILLLPRQIYQKLSDKKLFLFLGVVFVGLADMIFPLIDKRVMAFGGKSVEILNYNIGMAIVFTLILGFLDVIFFTLPVFDFIRFIKKDGPLFTNLNLIRFAKSYILAHFMVIPFNGIFYWIMYNERNIKALPYAVILIAVIYTYFIMPAWFSGIITRGANLIFDIELNKKPLVFAVIFTWNYILGNYAFNYIINHWVLWFFR